MTMKKGKLCYVPPLVLEEVNIIKHNYMIDKQADALKKMTSLSKLGMEVEKMSGYYFVENKLKRKK